MSECHRDSDIDPYQPYNRHFLFAQIYSRWGEFVQAWLARFTPGGTGDIKYPSSNITPGSIVSYPGRFSCSKRHHTIGQVVYCYLPRESLGIAGRRRFQQIPEVAGIMINPPLNINHQPN